MDPLVAWIMDQTAWCEERAVHAITWLDKHQPSWRDNGGWDPDCFWAHINAIAEEYVNGPS